MAQQESLVKLKGKIGDLSFYKSNNVYQARMKTGPTKQQINNDPRFARTKENGQEFGRAANASKKLRDQLRELLLQGADPKFSNRLTGRMHRVLKADAVNARGERQVLVPNLPILVDLDCNLNAQLTNVFFLKARPAYDRASGTATLNLPAFDGRVSIRSLDGATHVRIQLGLAEFDAQNPQAAEVTVVASSYFDIATGAETAPETVSATLVPQPDSAVILLMGISYYQHVNGGYYPLTNGVYNALTFVGVDLP